MRSPGSPALTLLYAPADRLERAGKALAGNADVVVLDLEDAVVPAHKEAARDGLLVLLAEGGAWSGDGGREGDGAARPVQVRVNHRSTPWFTDDVEALAGLPGVQVRLPKVEEVAQVHEVAAALPGRPLHLLLESALGIERAFELATCDPQVASVGLGEAVLRSDLRVRDEAGLLWARGRLVNAARAAHLPAPMMSVYPHVSDLEGLVASCRVGRSLGFLGRAAIHPAQLGPIRDAFRPTEAEVSWAEAVLARIDEARSAGVGAFVLPDGSFLDVAMVEQARMVLEVARRP
jgi:citrate lyase subunit beta/citryl-CoA lyase